MALYTDAELDQINKDRREIAKSASGTISSCLLSLLTCLIVWLLLTYSVTNWVAIGLAWFIVLINGIVVLSVGSVSLRMGDSTWSGRDIIYQQWAKQKQHLSNRIRHLMNLIVLFSIAIRSVTGYLFLIIHQQTDIFVMLLAGVFIIGSSVLAIHIYMTRIAAQALDLVN